MVGRKSDIKRFRQRAEERLAKRSGKPKVRFKDLQGLVHELQVHQIELEMQNAELRDSQAVIEESRIKYSDLYDFAPVGYFTIDQAGEVAEANLAGAGLLGTERSKLIRRHFTAFVDPAFRSVFRDHFLRVLKTGRKQRCELKLVQKNGESFYASLESIPKYKSEGIRGQAIRTVISDIDAVKKAQAIADERATELARANEKLQAEVTQRRIAEESLRESEKRLQSLSYQLLLAQEAERKRISGELHDSIGQSLAAMKFILERKINQMAKGNRPPGIALEDILLMMQSSIQENRRIMANLRPSILDDLGVIVTMNWFCREFEKTYPKIKVQKRVDIREEEILDRLKVVIFRILQEAMNNAANHSRGDLVSVALKKTDGVIEFKVSDNGRGFDPGTVERGLGLSSIEERVKLSGGALAVESSAGKGTTIHVRWPLEA